MDGNGRWARSRFLPRLEGHRRGAQSVRRVVEFCRKHGIEFLTLYAFSTENWQRPESEVKGLMALLSQFLDSELEELHAQDIRLRTIGNLTRLPASVLTKLEAAKEKTKDNQTMSLIIALSYGGRMDIVSAARKIVQEVKNGKLTEEDITEELFSSQLDTAGIPDPDLLIRSGGEMRMSNFLLWQAAYTELYFTATLWPDFDDDTFIAAIEEYCSRQRRFGMISEQIEALGKTT